MTKNVKNEVTVNPNPLHYPFPYYVKIADGDEASIKYYKRNGVPVSYIHLPHRMPHYYADDGGVLLRPDSFRGGGGAAAPLL